MSPMRYAYIGFFSGIALTYPPANILHWFACFSHSEFSSSFSETSTSYYIYEIYKQHDLKGWDLPLNKCLSNLTLLCLMFWNLYVWMSCLIQRNALGISDNNVTSIFLWINWPGFFLERRDQWRYIYIYIYIQRYISKCQRPRRKSRTAWESMVACRL